MKQIEFPEDVPLTSEEKYGKTYDSRVSAEDIVVIAPDGTRHSEILELPHVVHAGVCWIGFRFGETSGSCRCLLPLIALEDGDG